jgi:hypothetical protein
MSRGKAWEEEAARVTSEVARRAIRRLDVLEWVILAAAVGLAVVGGALVAWILAGSAGGGFRLVWMVTSGLLLIVPGVIVLIRHRREERKHAKGARTGSKGDDG